MLQDTHAIRLMLVDGDRDFLGDLWHEIESGEGREAIEIVGVMSCGAEAIALAAIERPEVILIDMDADTDERIGAIPGLIQACGARVLMLAGSRNLSLSARALKAGARGVILKKDSPATFRKAVCKVNDGELWFDRLTTGRIIEDLVAENLHARESSEAADGMADKLTARELEVVRALLKHEGAGSRDLAARLQVSEHTLRNHFTSIYRKLGVPNRTGLFAYASRLGLGRLD